MVDGHDQVPSLPVKDHNLGTPNQPQLLPQNTGPSPRNAKPYACTFAGCGKSFQRKEHLNRHSLNHAPSKTFSCDKCGKEFFRRDLYNRHMERHAKGMWFRRSGNMPKQAEQMTPPSQQSHSPLPPAIQQPAQAMVPQHQAPPPPMDGGMMYGRTNSISGGVGMNDNMYMGVPQMYGPPMHASMGAPPMYGGQHPQMYGYGNQMPPAPQQDRQDIYGIGSNFQEQDLHWLFNGSMDNMDVQLANSREPYSMPTPPVHVRKYEEEMPNIPEVDQETIWNCVRQRVKKTLFNLSDDQTSDSPLESCTLANSFSHDLIDSWLTNTESLKTYFDVYFQAYHDHFPILHKATMVKRPDRIHPLLMIAILTMGTGFANKEDFEISVKLHERLRWLIFSHTDLSTPPLWMFQALVLLQAFEKMLSIQSHHALAATFHSAMVNLLRRNQPRFDEEEDPDAPLHLRWQRWIENESFRRTYFLAFIMDAQHVALFGHRASMSANEIVFELPCLENKWDAEDAQTWNDLHADKSPIFLTGLKSLLMLKPLDATTSHFARLILLHGLYSVAIHMQMHKGQTLGMVNRGQSECKHCGSKDIQSQNYPFEHWKLILGQAISTWSYCLYTTKSITIEVCNALHQMAYVTLHLSPLSVLDVLVMCNYPLLIDRQISKSDYYRAKRAIDTWSKTTEAIMCVKHSLMLIQEVLFSRTNQYYMSSTDRYAAKVDKIALRPWCLFICTLVVYCFHTSLHAGQATTEVSDNMDIWMVTEQFISTRIQALASPNSQTALETYTRMDINNREAISCLIAAVRSTLPGCRWEMVEKAHACLGELINIPSGLPNVASE